MTIDITLWVIAGLMAAVFTLAGSTKLFIPRAKLASAPGGDWVLGFSPHFIKGLGIIELLGAVGLILPAWLDILPVLVPLAATGLAIIMVGAAVVTYRLHQHKHVLVNLTYLVLVAFLAVGRFGLETF